MQRHFQGPQVIEPLKGWAVTRRMRYEKEYELVILALAFRVNVYIREMELVFRKTREPRAATTTEWVELPGCVPDGTEQLPYTQTVFADFA